MMEHIVLVAVEMQGRREMIRRNCPIIALAATFLLTGILLTGCTHGIGLKLQDTRSWDTTGIDRINIEYPTDTLTISTTPSKQVSVKEYLSSPDEVYQATLWQSDRSLWIKAGKRPDANTRFASRIEVLLPSSYEGMLSVQTTTGTVGFDSSFHLTGIQVQTDTGNIRLGTQHADSIAASSKSGRITLSGGSGLFIGNTTAGSMEIGDFEGPVTLKSTTGAISLSLPSITGDVACESTSGKLSLEVPSSASFEFKMHSSTSNLSTFFDGEVEKESTAVTQAARPSPPPDGSPAPTPSPSPSMSYTWKASVGSDPAHLISLKTVSGPVVIKKV